MDKDQFIDAFFGVPGLKAAGIAAEPLWHSHFGAGDPDYWTDPRDKEFGSGSQYFQFNVAEAKKMLQAANFPLEQEFAYSYVRSATFGPEELIQSHANFLVQNGGFKIRFNPLSATEAPSFNQSGGTWEGILFSGGFHGSDLDQQLTSRFTPGAGNTVLYEKVPVPSEFTKFIDLIKKARMEPDGKKRVEILKSQVQNEMAIAMPAANQPGVAPYLTIAQPWVGNWGTFSSVGNVDPQELYTNYWFDASKKQG
jgi:ABC-type transport system substrate-binding protein